MDPAERIYSCDDHLDLPAVPRDLWQSRLPRAQAERALHVEERDGKHVWVCEDRVLGASGAGANKELLKKLSAIGRAGIEDDGFRSGTPKLRLEDMDRDNLWASVIYGPLAIGLPIRDPALQSACYAAWNDWAVEEFNAVAPDRLCVLGFLPAHSPEAAASELERCAGIGHRGAIIDVFEIDLADPGWDRLWAAAEQTGLPISFHLKGGMWSKSLQTRRIGKWPYAAYASVLPMQLDEPLALMMFSGALARHPGLDLVLAEAGHRLAALLHPSPGPRVGGAPRQARLRDRRAAERALPSPGDGHLRGGAAGHAVHPADRRRLVHVGVGLSAHRQHLPELAARDRGGAGLAVGRGSPQGHGHQLRAAVRLRDRILR